ncbi:MAG: hypothetical protein ACREBS_11325 [Nitrososphaerales archaeon]
MTPTQTLSNVVAGMLLIQVVLGGAAALLEFPIMIHLVWGVLTFIALIALSVLLAKRFGSRSGVFRVSLFAIIDFVVQGILGFISLGSNGDAILVHLTNAFILVVLVTMLISLTMRTTPLQRTSAAAAP